VLGNGIDSFGIPIAGAKLWFTIENVKLLKSVIQRWDNITGHS
jgi:hypothetical protein